MESPGCAGNARAGVLGIKKERAMFTGTGNGISCCGLPGRTYTPGNNANMLGSVLPIQNGRWDCVQVSKVQ